MCLLRHRDGTHERSLGHCIASFPDQTRTARQALVLHETATELALVPAAFARPCGAMNALRDLICAVVGVIAIAVLARYEFILRHFLVQSLIIHSLLQQALHSPALPRVVPVFLRRSSRLQLRIQTRANSQGGRRARWADYA